MNISITGTALNPSTWVPSPFAMSFSVNGGQLVGAGCDTALMGAAVTDFSAEVGNNPVSAPAAFAANVTTSACGAYGELVGGPLTLESQGALLVDHARLFNGNIGSWHIETASLTMASVPEPDSWALLIPIVLLLCAHVMCRWLSLLRRARSSTASRAPTRPAMAYAVLAPSALRS